MDCFESTPRIAFLSPEPGSGKSRALEVTEPLVPRPVVAVNCTPAYLFRKVGAIEGRPTLLYDEVDALFGPKAKRDNEEIRALMNAGHRKHSTAGRCVVKGKAIFTEEIPAYCAVALAGLGDLPDTIMTRAVIVRMRRRAPTETIEPYRTREEANTAAHLFKRLENWTASVVEALSAARPAMPPGVVDRNADVWEALLAIADAAGGDWPERARVAAVALVALSMGGVESLGVRLLRDLKTVFGEQEAMATDDLLQALKALPENPWEDWGGKGLTPRVLAHKLKAYGITSKVLRIGIRTPRGYARSDLRDAWERYLSAPPMESATSATSATPESDFFPDEPQESRVVRYGEHRQ